MSDTYFLILYKNEKADGARKQVIECVGVEHLFRAMDEAREDGFTMAVYEGKCLVDWS